MDAAKKGERYARVFRKAGAYLARGDAARAVETLKRGAQLARSLGDERMARRFEDEITRAGGAKPPPGT